jgi:hypothetical protein
MRKLVRTIFGWLAGTVLVTLALTLCGEWLIEVARDKGWYKDAGSTFDRWILATSDFLLSPWISHLIALIVGVTIGLWMDTLLRRRETSQKRYAPIMTTQGKPDIYALPMTDETAERFREGYGQIHGDKWYSLYLLADEARRQFEDTAAGQQIAKEADGNRHAELDAYSSFIAHVIPLYGIRPPSHTSEPIKLRDGESIRFRVNGLQMDSTDDKGREFYRFIHAKAGDVPKALQVLSGQNNAVS